MPGLAGRIPVVAKVAPDWVGIDSGVTSLVTLYQNFPSD